MHDAACLRKDDFFGRRVSQMDAFSAWGTGWLPIFERDWLGLSWTAWSMTAKLDATACCTLTTLLFIHVILIYFSIPSLHFILGLFCRLLPQSINLLDQHFVTFYFSSLV